MKKLICLLIFLASYYLASGSLLKVHPQTDKADLTIGQYIVGWKVPIEITSSVFAGLKIVIEFTTEETPRNEAILSLGSGMDSGKSMEFGITLVENGNHIDLVRKVKVRDAVRDHTTPSWNRTILKRSTNYILTLEIDETRLRYSLQDVGNPSDIQYEYQYDGLSPTYVRSQMEKNGVYVSVDRYHYLVQSLEVTELGYGVGVKPIIPDTHVRHGKIKNVNSGYYLSRLGSTYTSDYLLQKSASQTVNELWKLTTERQSDRTINAYNAVLTSCYRGTNVGPRNCTTSDGAYVYEMVSSDCNIWSVESNSQIRPELKEGKDLLRYLLQRIKWKIYVVYYA